MMNMRLRSILGGIVACTTLVSAAQGSTISYATGFGVGDDTLDVTGSAFTLDTGTGSLNYHAQNINPAQSHSAGEQFTNVSTTPAGGFAMETKFTLSGDSVGSGSDASVGFMFLSNNGNVNAAGAAYYLADWRATQSTGGGGPLGRLRVVGVGTGSTIASFANAAAAPVTAGTYIMRLKGIYQNTGAISLTFGVFDETGTTQIGTYATATTSTTPLTGQYFGIRNRSGGHGGGSPPAGWTTDASYDYLNVTSVPEPASLSLVLLMSAILATRQGGHRRGW